MVELTAENVLDYLRQRGWIGPEPARAETLSGGVSNAVLRVVTPARAVVVKQSRPQLRTRDAWFSDLERVYREQEVMQTLAPLLPAQTVPEVLFVDRPNYVFVMSHAPEGATVWKESLLAGRVDRAVAERAGLVLGRMHQQSAVQPARFERFRDHTVFVQLRVEPYYRRIQERRPEVAEAVEPLIHRMLTLALALCHGDFSPKNILVHEQGFTLVDYETAHVGDPTMDLGFFLSHLLLKAVKRQPQRQEYFDLTRAFWQRYAEEARFLEREVLETYGIAHCAVCLLARIDGTSPVEYLTEETKRQAVRRLGRQLLDRRLNRWDQVLDLCERELSG
jgi:5-methylthioribose kinase